MFIENEAYPLRITMTEGDFGITLPIEIETKKGETITENTDFIIKIFKKINTEPLISKTYSDIENNTIEFSLTQEESSRLPTGDYCYDLDWYQNGVFMCNLVRAEEFVVEEKAGGVNGSSN
jgi:hypothetical protein